MQQYYAEQRQPMKVSSNNGGPGEAGNLPQDQPPQDHPHLVKQRAGQEQNDQYLPRRLSRSNTVDGVQSLDLEGSSGNPNGDRGGASNQGRPAAGTQAATGAYSSAANAAQGRQIRTSLFVGPLSPLHQGNGKTSSIQANGNKKSANGNVNARVGAANLVNSKGAPANASAEAGRKNGAAQKSQGRDRVEANPRAQSSDALPLQASPHLKREQSNTKSKQAQEQLSQKLGQLPGGAASRNNPQMLHGRHVGHAQTLNQHQNQLLNSFEPMIGLQGQMANRSRLNNLPGQGNNLVANHQASQNFPAVMRANQLLEQKRHTMAGQTADSGSQNRLASSKPFQMRTNKMSSNATENANAQAQAAQNSSASNRKLSGDSNRLRGNRFRNIYNPQQQEAFDYGPPAPQSAAGALPLGQQIESSNGNLLQQIANQQTGDMSANQANRQKPPSNLNTKSFIIKNGKNALQMSSGKPAPHQQAQQSPLFNQQALEQHRQPTPTTAPKDDQQFSQINPVTLNIETSVQTGAISLPNNNLRASRQRNHALMKPQPATEILQNQQSSFNAQQMRQQIGQKWNNINKSNQRGPIVPIDIQGGPQVQGPTGVVTNYGSTQQASGNPPKRHHESASNRDASARSQRSGISDVVSNRSRRAQQLAQHNMDANKMQASDQMLNHGPSRNGALNTHSNTDQLNAASNTGKFSGKQLKRFSSPLTKAQMPQRTSLQNVENQNKMTNAAKSTQRQGSSKFNHQVVPQRFQGIVGQHNIAQSKDLDNGAGKIEQNYQSDGTLRTEQRRKNSQPTVGHGVGLRPGSSSIQNRAAGAQILKNQAHDSQIAPATLQNQNPSRQNLQSRQGRNKSNQTRNRTEADQNKLKQFVESGSLNQAPTAQTANTLKQDFQRPTDPQTFMKKQQASHKLGYLQQQQDQLKQQAAMANVKIDKLVNQQFTGATSAGQNQRKPLVQKRNNSQDQPNQQKNSEQRNRMHKKGMSAQVGADLDNNLELNQQAMKQPESAYAVPDAQPSPGMKSAGQQYSQYMKSSMNKDALFSPKNHGEQQSNMTQFDDLQKQSKFAQNNKDKQKSRNPNIGLVSNKDKAAFLSNKEQMASFNGYVDQQCLKQPTTSTVNSMINTSREGTRSSSAEARGEASQKNQDNQGAGTGETAQPPSIPGSKTTKEKAENEDAAENKRSESQMKETIQNQRSLPDKNGNFCKVILEVEREGQQQYINFKNGHNPILNIIEAQLKGLIQGSTFLGGLGSGNENDQTISYNPLKDFEEAKFASKSHGLITSYSANTHQGIQRNYNEDRVSIILNMTRPPNKDAASWPKCSFFAIYDGHGGSSCADFLKDHLHQIIIGQSCFPKDPRKALVDGCRIAEEKFLKLAMKDPQIDKSGSCAIIVLTVETECYVANVGDSRAIMSAENGLRVYELSQDHRPNEEDEFYRIQDHGGQVYQTQTYQTIPITNQFGQVTGQSRQMLYGPYRVLPGRLSVSRTFGDIEAKDESLGGKKGVVIAEPEISQFSIDEDKHDFIVLGCDGIFDRLTSVNCLDSAWSAMSQAIKSQKENNKKPSLTIHQITGKMADAILRSSAIEKSYDNLTIVIVAFKNLSTFYSKAKQQTRKQYLNISVQNESHS